MAPKKRSDKGKAPASQEPSKELQATPSKEKLLSSAMPIKSWIELVEEHEAKYKSISSEDQVKQWMSSITKSPELMIALQSLSQSQPKEEEKPTSKEISKPSSQNIVVSGESSSSQIVLSQPTPSKKTSDWFDKAHFQNIASKQIFARWQAILSVFYFDIEFIKGDKNSVPDFLTREFLQNR